MREDFRAVQCFGAAKYNVKELFESSCEEKDDGNDGGSTHNVVVAFVVAFSYTKRVK
jgi:hypothetical protein